MLKSVNLNFSTNGKFSTKLILDLELDPKNTHSLGCNYQNLWYRWYFGLFS